MISHDYARRSTDNVPRDSNDLDSLVFGGLWTLFWVCVAIGVFAS